MRLGQHFLKNKNQLQKIVGALELKSGDLVLEIGPGHGELTRILAEKFQMPNSKFKIIAIEKDKALVGLLSREIASESIQIIEGDILEVLSKVVGTFNLKPKTYKLVGNIPYYLTGHLFRIIGDLEHKPSLIVFTIQKEVALRITAKPPLMNLLAASIKFWAEPKIIGYIPKEDFKPAPKVDSAIIRLEIRNQKIESRNMAQNYYKFIRALFKQPRKTISNNLRLLEENPESRDEKIKKIGMASNNRPQDLSIEQIIELSRIF